MFGFNLNATLAIELFLFAISLIIFSSSMDSTLKHPIPNLIASKISSSVLPTPAYAIFEGVKPQEIA